MDDELFTPTIPEQDATGKLPWRPDSIIYPAFFGGPLGAATLGVVNGRRLGLPRPHLVAIAAAGVAGFAARLLVRGLYSDGSAVRFTGAVAGVLVWLVVIRLQRRPFRAFAYRGGKPDSLVGPGIAAALGCGVLEAMLIAGLIP